MLINVISSYPLHTNFARSQSARLQRNWIVTATDNKRVVGMLMLLSDAALLIDVSVGRGGLERADDSILFPTSYWTAETD